MNYCKGSENFPLNPPRDSAHDKADGLSSLFHREKELVSNHRHKALRVHR